MLWAAKVLRSVVNEHGVSEICHTLQVLSLFLVAVLEATQGQIAKEAMPAHILTLSARDET